MFHCDRCKSLVGPKVEGHRVVAEVRERNYPTENGDSRRGWEIAREALLCTPCKDSFKSVIPIKAERTIVSAPIPAITTSRLFREERRR